MTTRRTFCSLALSLLTACGSGPGSADAGGDGATPATDGAVDASMDSGGRDSGGRDAAPPRVDGGPPPSPADCAGPDVLCVDDDPGPTQEYATIQEAVDVAGAGDTVLVFEGRYVGFRVTTSGTAGSRLAIRAVGVVDLTGPTSGADNVVRIQNASYVTIDGFRIAGDGSARPYDYDFAGMAARGANPSAPMRGLVIRDMEISGSSPAGFYCSECAGLVLEGNYIHHNVREAEGGNGMGVYLSNAATDDVVVRFNRFEDNAGPGIHMNGDASIGGDGVQTGDLFEGNTFIGNGQNGLNMDGVQDVTFVNNVFADNARHAIRGFRIDAAEGPAGFTIVNNTFALNADTPVKFSDDGGGHVVFNNLLVANSGNDFEIAESTPMVRANLREASAGGVLRDAAARDYRLADGSAAIDAGVGSFAGHDAPADDFAGATRDATPDIGAYEHP